MKSIREQVFETNSSSVHSISFSNSVPKKIKVKHLELYGNYWGWERKTWKLPQDKFSYWFNAFIQNNHRKLLEACADKKEMTFDQLLTEPNTSLAIELYKEYALQCSNHLIEVFEVFERNGIEIKFRCARNYIDGNIIFKEGEVFSDWQTYIRLFELYNLNKHDFTKYDSLFDYIVPTGSGIDHQSGPNESMECKQLAELGPEKVLEWVCGDGYFETGNDNDWE